MQAVAYTIVPVIAVVLGAIVGTVRRPGPAFTSAMQHLAAGIVFAAAATEVLPQVRLQGSTTATLVGGAAGIVVMLALKRFEAYSRGRVALLAAIGIDLLIDGLVLGLAFVAGAQAGVLLTIGLTVEVGFLGLSLMSELGGADTSRLRIITTVAGLGLLMPVGALVALPIASLPPVIVTAFLSFGLMALLYLVTEELLVEAHEKPDTPLISAFFFIGFLAIVASDESIGQVVRQ